MDKAIDVVAAVIVNKENKILICQRNFKKSQGGLWEFPGGKVEKDETKEAAIEREIKEELVIDVEATEILEEKEYIYPEKKINLVAIKCTYIAGTVIATEHAQIKWVDKKYLDSYTFAPADYFIVDYIKHKL